MKDAKGHGSEKTGANGSIPPKFMRPRATPAHQQDIVKTLRTAVMPDLSRVTQMPKWLAYFGKAQRRARRQS
jgi:hypothetical protein